MPMCATGYTAIAVGHVPKHQPAEASSDVTRGDGPFGSQQPALTGLP